MVGKRGLASSDSGAGNGGEPSREVLGLGNVMFSYPGGRRVLSGVSLDVRRGECVCLMGVNGCGKSTLLDCILQERRDWSGRIAIEGNDVRRLKPLEMARLASYVPQVHDRSFPYTVEHVVMMGRTAWMGGSPDDEDRRVVGEAMDACGIRAFAERPYTELSGGEMQMVLLARALAQDAPLIIMDEPTAHLDFKNELVFLETVERLLGEGGTSILMATHSPNQAFHLAHAGVPVRVAVMDKGQVVACDAPDAVLAPQLLEDVFGVRALLLKQPVEAGGNQADSASLSQLVPLATVKP